MKTIREIAKVAPWKDVEKAIKFHYPSDKNNYKSLYIRLGKMPKQKVDPNDQLVIQYGGIENGKDGYDCGFYSCYTTKYSCSFRPWKLLANLTISAETLRNFSPAEIVAFFIYEITFYGDEKQMKKVGKELERTVKKAKKALDKGDMSKFKTLDEVKKELKCEVPDCPYPHDSKGRSLNLAKNKKYVGK